MDKGAIIAMADQAGFTGRDRRSRVYLAALLMAITLVFAAASARAEGSAPAKAGAHVLINGKAIHFNSRPNVSYNESNWGVGFQYDWDQQPNGWVPFVTASGFDDSNRNPSYYAGGGMLRRFHFRLGDTRMHTDIGFIGFLMVRKGFRDGDPFAGVLPAFSIGSDRVSVNISYVPRVDPKAVPLVFFQLKLKLGQW